MPAPRASTALRRLRLHRAAFQLALAENIPLVEARLRLLCPPAPAPVELPPPPEPFWKSW